MNVQSVHLRAAVTQRTPSAAQSVAPSRLMHFKVLNCMARLEAVDHCDITVTSQFGRWMASVKNCPFWTAMLF